MAFDLLHKRSDMAHSFSNFDFSMIQHGSAGRIVTPVFQTTEPLQKKGHGVGIPNIPDDSTHD
jgi:hypothetical protein